MKLLSKAEMEKLTTKRLLAYKGTLMQVPETPDWDATYDGKNTQINKTTPAWKETYHNLKSVLETRENVK